MLSISCATDEAICGHDNAIEEAGVVQNVFCSLTTDLGGVNIY